MASQPAANCQLATPTRSLCCPGPRFGGEFFLVVGLVDRQRDEGGSQGNGRPVSPHGVEWTGSALKASRSRAEMGHYDTCVDRILPVFLNSKQCHSMQPRGFLLPCSVLYTDRLNPDIQAWIDQIGRAH